MHPNLMVCRLHFHFSCQSTTNRRCTNPNPHGRKLRGTGRRVPRIWSGTIMQIVSQILSCFKISSIRLLALQCGKMFANPMTLTEYSLHPNTSSTSTKYFRRKFNIFLARTRTKIPLTMHQNTPFEMKNF